MTATYRSVNGEAISADATGHTCVLPAGVATGDFLIYAFVGNGHSITAFDSNYPIIGSRQEGGNADMTCFGGVYTGTAPVIDYDIPHTPDGNLSVVAIQRSGSGTLTLDQNTANGPSSGTSHATSSVTPGFNDSCVVAIFGGEATVVTGTVGGSFTERRDYESWGHNYIATYNQTTAASTSATMTSSVSEAAVHRIMSVYEASSGTTVTPTTLALTTATFAPTVTASDHKTVTPTTKALTLATFAPTVRVGQTVTPTTLALVLTTYAPTVTGHPPALLDIGGTEYTEADVLDRSPRWAFNSFDVTLVDPATDPTVGDSFDWSTPAWSGSVVRVSSRVYANSGVRYVQVAATNSDVAGASAAPYGLSDTPNGSTTFGYRDLFVDRSWNDPDIETRITLKTDQAGFAPGQTVELTNVLEGFSADDFTIAEMRVEWPRQSWPVYELSLGAAIVDMSVWVNSAAAGVLPITTTKISDGAVTTPKVAAGAITANEIAANTITAGQIAANAITASEIAADAVSADKITVLDDSLLFDAPGDALVGGIIMESGRLVMQADNSDPFFSGQAFVAVTNTEESGGLERVVVSGVDGVHLDTGNTLVSFYENGLATGASSFPGSPTTGRLFYRTDLHMWFYYTGSSWASVSLFTAQLRATNASGDMAFSATATSAIQAAVPSLQGGSDILVVRHIAQFYVTGGTALGASHKWVGTVQRFDSANSANTFNTINIASGSSDVWRTDEQTVNGLLHNGTTRYRIATTWTKTGTPGTLLVMEEMTYRIVAT